MGLMVVTGCSGSSSPCSNPPSTCPSSVPSFQRDVNSIIVGSCLPCHDPTTGIHEPPALNGYAAISSAAGPSLDQISRCLMPPTDGGFALAAADRQSLMTWYVCGAPNN
jgi:hypothetical protein